MNVVAIIQARMTSTRLPGKIMMDLAGKPVLQNIVERINRATLVDKVVVATSVDSSDDLVETFLSRESIPVFRGDLFNVLDRFYNCAKYYDASIIVRCTADNALIDPSIIDDAISMFMDKHLDYLYYKPNLPLGMGIEVFTFNALEKAHKEATDPECLEHVTPYIRINNNRFNVQIYDDSSDLFCSNLRFTMDTPQDYEFVNRIYTSFNSNDFTYDDVMNSLRLHPDWININNSITQKDISYTGEINY